MNASVIDFASGKVAEDEKQAAFAARRRSLEAKRHHLDRALQELENEETEAEDKPLWNTILGGRETVCQFVGRLTQQAMQKLAEDDPGGAHMCLEMARHYVEIALKAVREREEKKRAARRRKVQA
jgi:hypothetical protein